MARRRAQTGVARRRTLTWMLLSLVAIAAAAQVAYLAVVSRSAFRAWLKAEMERNARGVFSFGRIGGNPLRIRLAELAFESRGPTNIKRLHAPVAYAGIDWLPLLRERRIVIRSVLLERASVEVRLEGGRPEQIALPLPAGRVELRASSVQITQLSGWTAFLTAVNAVVNETDVGGVPVAVSAWFEAGRVSVGALALQDAKGSVRVGSGTLEFVTLEAALYGGAVRASGSMLLDSPQTLQRVDIAAKGIDVLPALRGLRYSERFAGKAALEAGFTGRLAPSERNLRGRGHLGVERLAARADLPRINLFNVAPVLRELRRVDNLVGGAELLLDGPKVELTGLLLEKRDLKITGSGYLSLGGDLAADCRAYLRGELAQGVPQMVRSSLQRTDAGDLIVPFKVGNTLAEPKVDIGTVVKGALLHPFKKGSD